MAERSDRDIELNPNFFVPPGVIDVRQENKENTDYVYSGITGDIVTPGSGPILEFPTSPIPNAPSGFTIVSQTQRQGSDGSTVVDVLFEFPDVGVFDVDVRVTPA